MRKLIKNITQHFTQKQYQPISEGEKIRIKHDRLVSFHASPHTMHLK